MHGKHNFAHAEQLMHWKGITRTLKNWTRKPCKSFRLYIKLECRQQFFKEKCLPFSLILSHKIYLSFFFSYIIINLISNLIKMSGELDTNNIMKSLLQYIYIIHMLFQLLVKYIIIIRLKLIIFFFYLIWIYWINKKSIQYYAIDVDIYTYL